MGLFDDVLKPSNVQNQDDTTQPAQTDQASSSGMFDDILKPKDRTIGSVAKDVGITALKGAISLPEAAVGVADIVTGGEAGKALEGIGFRPKEAKAILDEGYSEKQKLANAKLQNAEGFVDTVATAVQNPSTILNAAIESAPLILGGGAIGAGARALKASPVIAGAVGEGIVGAGMAAEGTRQQTEDGLLTDKQAALSALSGVGTAALGAAGGKLAQKLGITDIDTAATGAVTEASKDGLLKRTVKGALGEGVFEELPQSVQEQVLSNAALDKPLFEGVDNAAAMGMLTGGVMGGGISAINTGVKTPADTTTATDQITQQQNDIAVDAPLDDFEAFKQQSETEIERRKIAAGIKKPTENIDAADILGGDNVSDMQNDAPTELANSTIESAGDNVQGGVGDLSDQFNAGNDTGRTDNAAEALAQSSGADISTGNAGRGNDAVNTPLESNTSWVLREKETGKAILETTDKAKVDALNTEKYEAVPILQHLQELNQSGSKARNSMQANNGIADNVEAVNITQERVDKNANSVQVKQTVLQNRDRSQPESINQMRSIAANPDPSRLSFSRDAANGAPVVAGKLPASAVLGKLDHAITANNRKLNMQYAVVDASDVIASHDVNGNPIAEYSKGGKLQAIGGNGRIAGLQEAFRNNNGSSYIQGIAEDSALHGVPADAIRGMKNPVLIRVMNSEDITPTIGDELNGRTNMGLSVLEQAKTDTARLKLEALDFNENGEVTQDAIKAFVMAMPENERNELMDGGRVGRKAEERLMAAVFNQAYGDDELVRIYSQAQDVESKAVINALAIAAPAMARLTDAGNLDIRSIVADAAKVAVNSSREGVSLTKLAAQGDLELGKDVMAAVRFMAQNIRRPKLIGEELTKAAQFAYEVANQQTMAMFDLPNITRDDIIRKVANDYQGSEENLGEQGRGQSDGGNVRDEADQGRGQADTQTPESLELTGQTNEEINAGIAAKEAEAKAKSAAEKSDAAAKVEAERKARQTIAADSFDLTLTGKTAKETQANDAKQIDNQFAGQGDLLTAPEIAQPSKEIQSLEARIEKEIAKRTDMQTKHMEKYRNGSATRAQTTTYNANVGRVNDTINELRAEIKALKAKEPVASSDEAPSNSQPEEVIHNGIRLYKLKIRNKVEGQPPTEMWAVESLENKSRKERGERAIGGDTLTETLDEAKAEADFMLKRDAEKNKAEEAQAKREAAEQEKSRINADKKSDIDGFGAELNAMQLGKLKETLNKQTSIKGEVAPLRDTVRKLVAQGGKPEIKEENVYKGMSRAQYNRADNRAQQEDEKRIREGGKKNVYYITMPDGGMYELGKTAHDFAEHLILKKNSDVPETDFGNTKPEAKTQAKADLDAALGDLGNIFGKTYRAEITPEQEQKIIPVLTRVFDAAFRLGYYEFKAAAKFVMDTIRTKIGSDVADLVTLDYLQGAYISMAGKYKDQATSKKDVVNVESLEELQGNSNVTNERSSTDLERDSGNAGTSNEVGAESIQAGREGNGRTGRSGVQGTETESGSGSSEIVPNSETISIREQSNIEVQTGQSPSDASIARDSINRGSGDSGLTGQPIEPEATERIDEVAQGGLFEVEARRDQKAADAIPQELSIENIRETLPILKTGQQEDVLKAETRFAEPEGYGMLFTNGTGTGKTFTGLGIIKRFANRGKTNVLVVAPNDKIIEDWQKSGKLLGLNLNRLDSTTESGTGIIITTYANMGANQSLADRNWDLVVHDEAHYLAMDKDGTNTNALKTLRAITKHPDGAYTRHQMMYRTEYANQKNLRDQLQVTIDKGRSNLLSDKEAEANDKENDRLSLLLEEGYESLRATTKIVQDDVKESQGLQRPRALFLSATPFAYEKTVDWANGYLFDYSEGQTNDQTESRGYNSGSNRDRFMMQHFGYRMRYNKLTAPDAKVNSGLMQRQFNTFLKKKGSLSGRMLDVDADYDRKFILVDSAIGARIDEALQWFEEKRKAIGESPLGSKDPRKAALYDVQKLISEKFDYLSRRYLLESIKAREVITHVKEHMAIGRKVVVFHDYKKGGGFNPFDLQEFSPSDLPDAQAKVEDINQVIQEFRAEFIDLINSPEFKSTSPIDAFKKEFPNVLLFNGDVQAKKRRENVATFNDDNNGPQVILVQSAAGKEGISLHDTTGKHQRVLFNLGQPTQPTTSIQQEGRIYRTGQVTDAIFRYLNTGTNWERWAFARDVANRASAAENLALGEQARALKDAFISAFEESDDYRAGMEMEGKGGKERDKAANEALTEYDRAKAFYYGTQKKTSKTKAQEGADYFATPEPVGLKMIELADIRAGEKVLEPSAGHGAIARWMPEGSDKFAIEPSSSLRPRLAMVFDGNIISSDFEDLNIVNKFDAIVMNPPFGSAGRTAIDHVIKASNHLKDGGRIVALIPVGSTDKKFDKWFYETETRPLKPIFEKDNIQVFAGDTVVMEGFNNTFEIKDVVIDTMAGGTQYFRTKGQSKESGVIASAVKSVKPVGARIEEYNPSKGLSLVAEIKLPSVTFERAGTAVNTRIVVIEKSDNAPQQTNRDYTQVTDINDLFDRMETLSIPARAMPVNDDAATEAKPAAQAKPELESVSGDFDIKTAQFEHSKTKETMYVAALGKRLEREEYDKVNAVAKANGGYYSAFKGAGAIQGFLFKSEEARQGFISALNQDRGNDTPMFTRGAAVNAGLSKATIQTAVNNLRSTWKNAPEIIVVQDMNDPAIRKAVRDENDRQLSQGAQGQPEAFFDNGKVYIVASEMNSANDVIRVVFHEALGHYGLRGLYGKDLGKVLDQVAMLRPREMKAKAKSYGLDLTKASDKNIAAEEILAEMAQTAPNAGLVKRAIAAIRSFLRNAGVKLELSDNDIIVNYLLPARGFVVNGKASSGIAGSLSAFNRNTDPSIAQLFQELTLSDDLFKYPRSSAKDMQEVFDDVAQGLVQIEKSKSFDDEISELYSVYPIDATGKPNRSKVGFINVYEDGKVEINVLALGEGFGGSRIYAAVGNWAYNNGKVFAGDREGISPAGITRRLENMISLALKFGTTDHIMPHQDQMNDLGFDWKEGDYNYNLAEMLKASFNAIRNGVYVTTDNFGIEVTEKSKDAKGVSKLDDLVYDFDKHQFTDVSNGQEYTESDFDKLARTAEARNTYAGRTTLQRAAIGNTFMGATGERKRSLLEQLGKLSLQSVQLTDPQLAGIFYSRSTPNSAQSRLTPEWNAPETSKLDSIVYTLQDKHVDLKRVTQAIKAAGTEISDRWNAYLQEELYHGRTAKRTQDFIKNDLNPLIEDMRMRGVAMADFEEFLWARHAEERNIQIAKVNPKMPDSGSGMSTKDARDYLANLSPANKAKYEALAKRVDAINQKSRQVLIDYGLESASTIAAWEGAYKNYVPLMREDMDAGFGNGTGQGFSVKGNASKRATGSNRAVVDIIANIAQQYEKNVIRGEKNRVSTALIGLAKLNPNEEFWEVDTPPTIKTIVKGGTVYDVLYNGNKAAEFTNKNAALNYINAKGITGYAVDERQAPDHVEYVTDPNYKNRGNVIVARIVNKLGKVEERSVVFNQFDERAMRMAASIKNLDQDQIGELLGTASAFTRYFASINTQYNPIFGVVNITRDIQGALLNLSTTPIADKKTEVLKNTTGALKGIYQDLRSQRKTGQAATNKWATLFEEFQNEGGQTGFRDMYRNAKERGEALKDALDPTWWKDSKIGKVISLNGVIANQEQWIYDKAIKPIFEWLEDYNIALENAVRLSVYKVSLDNGHSKQQAASMAKNISVNFNRKGEMGRQIGSLYAFFNASVQGTARIGETMLNRDADGKLNLSTMGKRVIQGGLLLGAMQALMLVAAGFDDDEPPEFVKDRSLIIPIGDGKFITIPMPLGYNAIPSMGRIVTEWMLSGGEDTQKRLIHIVDMLLDVTNPIGNAGLSLQTITPTVIDPLSALAENKDFTGRPISREDMSSLDPTPGFTRSRDKAWDFSVAIARGINWVTGGTDVKQGAISPTADQLEYLAGQFTGGVGREIIKTGTTADSMVTGEELPTYKIPLVGRFYGDSTGQSSQGAAFYNNVRSLNEHQAEIKNIKETGGNVAEYIAENPDAALYKTGDLALRQINSLRKRQRLLKENDADKESIKAIDERITAIMKKLNDSVKLAKEKEAS